MYANVPYQSLSGSLVLILRVDSEQKPEVPLYAVFPLKSERGYLTVYCCTFSVRCSDLLGSPRPCFYREFVFALIGKITI